jgi:C-terminal processing protease CtpA/Prc
VLDVIQQSPAARQGLAGGDVLVAIDGKDVRAHASEAVFSMLRQLGRHVEITIDRGGTRLTRTVTLARLI